MISRGGRAVDPRARDIRVICFDVDGTLIEHAEGKTVWQLLNEAFIGEGELNARRLLAHREGDITYAEWVDLDILDWCARSVERPAIEAIVRDQLHPVPGARETVERLAAGGYRLAIVSGTLDVTLDLLLDGLPFTRRYANRIWFDGRGRIAGWRATRYDGRGKLDALHEMAAACGCTPEQCAFVGDHWNDLAALRGAGLGIAYRPKDDTVRHAADLVVETGPLTRLLEIFGKE
jgi:HAD superfamily phosphoserine phosphatase-like hydrolase